MKRFLIQNRQTKRYFLMPGHGDTSRKEAAHIYTAEDVTNPRFKHLALGLDKGITVRVPVMEPVKPTDMQGPDNA